ncbi:MAG: hypothetical protein M1834_001483 [Cirrosporium novae-zelandiae]|nr:MAG: hypothetical protein M1834_008611 [Cirrosporium novae-zelandiae]KAI9736017.1 MAG: hypothetical protein M1834_001483 [Cirrosporium novae-zelandiae]
MSLPDPPGASTSSSSDQGFETNARGNPRRCPAHLSVSLRPSPSGSSALRGLPPNSFFARNNRTTRHHRTSKLAISHSSRRAPSSLGKTTMDGWFDDANRNAQHPRDVPYNNDDSPFYMGQTSDEDTPAQSGPCSQDDSARASLSQLNLGGTSDDGDFRSVIDDLTIENQRLKKRLRKYEATRRTDMEKEKLFEVRMSGLPPHKKRELEETLRKFALSLDNVSEGTLVNSDVPMSGQGAGHDPIRMKPESPISSASNFRPVDSGYGSASLFNTSSGVSHGGNPAIMSRERNVKNYLEEIPEHLLPKHSLVMTERVKMKLIVRRLENIFTGQKATKGGHSQPLQQQEVSHSAALADRNAITARGDRLRAEGKREARIMPLYAPRSTTPSQGHTPATLKKSRSSGDSAASSDNTTIPSGSGSPTQRPTRPLDLDPNRAQIPSDNLDYIRHLGLSAPTDILHVPSTDEEGWVYLNLISSMAQLHTLNVTPGLVRKTVSEMSSKLEISEDGHKIRWQGGTEGTHLSSDSGSTGDQDVDNYQTSNSRPSKSRSVESSRNKHSFELSATGRQSSNGPQRSKNQPTFDSESSDEKLSRENKFAYKPLVFHRMASDDDEFLNSSDSAGGSSELSSYHLRFPSTSNFDTSSRGVTSISGCKLDDGPIIFFKKSHFFTDLSGDLEHHSIYYGARDTKRDEHQILGLSHNRQLGKKSERHDYQRPFSQCSPVINLQEDDDEEGRGEEEEEGHFDLEPLRCTSPSAVRQPKEFEASGIGGVYPADNFMVNVRVHHANVKTQRSFPKTPTSSVENVQKNPKLNHQGKSFTGYHMHSTHIISAETKDLLPSTLPPPNYFFMPFTSSEDEDDEDDEDETMYSDSDDDTSVYSLKNRQLAPPSFLNMFRTEDYDKAISIDDDGEDEDEDEDEESNTNDSVDMSDPVRTLLDPSSIAVEEHQLQCDRGREFAEELPAGSSAATAGGGSGYVSDARSLLNMKAAVVGSKSSQKRGRRSINSSAGAPNNKIVKMEVD